MLATRFDLLLASQLIDLEQAHRIKKAEKIAVAVAASH